MARSAKLIPFGSSFFCRICINATTALVIPTRNINSENTVNGQSMMRKRKSKYVSLIFKAINTNASTVPTTPAPKRNTQPPSDETSAIFDHLPIRCGCSLPVPHRPCWVVCSFICSCSPACLRFQYLQTAPAPLLKFRPIRPLGRSRRR